MNRDNIITILERDKCAFEDRGDHDTAFIIGSLLGELTTPPADKIFTHPISIVCLLDQRLNMLEEMHRGSYLVNKMVDHEYDIISRYRNQFSRNI